MSSVFLPSLCLFPPTPIPITLRFPYPPTFCPSLFTLANTPGSPLRFPIISKPRVRVFIPNLALSQTLPLEQEILLRKYDHVFVNAEDGRDGMKRGEVAHQRGFCLANACDEGVGS